MAAPRKYGTCFFEQYAQISLCALLGSEFECLVNRDRPDLQSEGSDAIGIEVTRAMEESRRAEQELLKDVAGITLAPEQEDETSDILEYGYAYGLRGGKYIGAKELPYWEMALPLRRILESKVQKVGNGFYGHFRKMGLYVFCKDQLSEMDVYGTMSYTIGLQKYLDNRFNRLYLADVDDLFVCNLDDGLRDSSRLCRYPISQEQRRAFYLEAVRKQLEV
jgi:hypothetical protein